MEKNFDQNFVKNALQIKNYFEMNKIKRKYFSLLSPRLEILYVFKETCNSSAGSTPRRGTRSDRKRNRSTFAWPAFGLLFPWCNKQHDSPRQPLLGHSGQVAKPSQLASLY